MAWHRKVIICGDFNSHHGMWGSLSMDANGRTSVSFLESNDYVVLNTSTPWIRTEASFVRIRTGSDGNFFENWRIRTGSD